MSEQPRFAQPEANRTAVLQAAPDKLSGDSQSPSEAIAGGVGQLLRNAREGRSLSVAEAAQSLKLAPRQVEALEAEDWPSLPGNTMIRGFVRNYARLLGLNSEALMHALDAEHLQQTPKLEASAGTSASLPHVANRVERRDYLAIVAGLLLLFLALLAYLYVPADGWRERMSGLISAFSRTASSDRSPAPPPAERPAETPAAAQVTQAEPSALPAASSESVTTVTTPSAIVLSDTSTPAPQLAGSDQSPVGNRLKFTFGQAAWLQVRDGRGQVIVAETNAAGSQREVEGQPPFALVVGNATRVTLEYQGRVIDLAPHSKGEVARLNVE